MALALDRRGRVGVRRWLLRNNALMATAEGELGPADVVVVDFVVGVDVGARPTMFNRRVSCLIRVPNRTT